MKRMFIALALILFLPSFIFAETNEPSAEDLAEVMKGIGFANIRRGPYDKAIENFNMTIALNPKLVGPYIGRGYAYAKKGNMDRAISDFQKACDMGDKTGCNNLQILKNR